MSALRAMALLLALASCRCGPSSHGELLFRQQCALCHPTGEGIGQGPGLAGIVGRKAASLPGFGYSPALKASGIKWDRAKLDRWLSNPMQMVPGTTMMVMVPSPMDRHEIIDFLATLRPEGAPVDSEGSAELPSVAPPELRTGPAAFGDFRSDGPGVRRHITVADLPKPFATSSTANGPQVATRPPGAELHVPPGFSVSLFAQGLKDPRLIRTAPNGDLFIAESAPGKIVVLHGTDQTVFADSLSGPFGIAFYPPGKDPTFVYVAETNRVVRFSYQTGDLKARAPAEVIVQSLAGTRGGHSTRDVVFSPDGKRMFVSVGSGSNVADGLPSKSAADLAAWNASHTLGECWGSEDHRADVLVFNPDGSGEKVFATGIRNCVGMEVDAAGELWCSTNERDGLGDDLVPDYVTRVREGQFFGWPWFYMGSNEDPRQAGQRPDLSGHVSVPEVLLQPHSASLEMTFYDGAMFPPEYRGQAFAAEHGSWNRSERSGYKVVRIVLKDGVPTGKYEDFLTGFVINNTRVWGRPVGVAVAPDGALLVSEDGNGTIWRVSYSAKPSEHP